MFVQLSPRRQSNLVTFAALALSALALGHAATASAQPIGSFRWQLQPYCNVLTLTVNQQGGLYTLSGTDDQCNAPQRASALGLAFFNPGGTVGLGITLVTAPGGSPVHVEATVDLASLNGTWRDSTGNTGSFVFTPGAGIGGAPRPISTTGLPPNSVTAVQVAPGAIGREELAANAVAAEQVADASLPSRKLTDGPRGNFVGGNQAVSLTPTGVVVRALAIAVPGTGRVFAQVSGHFVFTGAGAHSARCSITTGDIIDSDNLIFSRMVLPGAPDTGGDSFGATRAFDTTGPTRVAVQFVCDGSGSTSVRDTQMSLIFVPET
jgi:hypothetical protein